MKDSPFTVVNADDYEGILNTLWNTLDDTLVALWEQNGWDEDDTVYLHSTKDQTKHFKIELSK